MATAKKTVKPNSSIPKVLVYGFINDKMCADFAAKMQELEGKHPVVNVHVNSKGGDVYSGIAMFNTAKNAKCAVDMYIDGVAISMASAFVMAGRKIYMSKYARLMTHKPSGFGGGTADELRRAADEVDALEPILASMYCKKTGCSNEEVYTKFLNGKDEYFGAEAAIAVGLVDGVYDGDPVMVTDGADAEAIYAAIQTKFEASLKGTTEPDMTDAGGVMLCSKEEYCLVKIK
jgi:ATP-dependent Clp endopeptidase proteolytic subunit ClpP